jgi:hypothetical protein
MRSATQRISAQLLPGREQGLKFRILDDLMRKGALFTGDQMLMPGCARISPLLTCRKAYP